MGQHKHAEVIDEPGMVIYDSIRLQDVVQRLERDNRSVYDIFDLIPLDVIREQCLKFLDNYRNFDRKWFESRIEIFKSFNSDLWKELLEIYCDMAPSQDSGEPDNSIEMFNFVCQLLAANEQEQLKHVTALVKRDSRLYWIARPLFLETLENFTTDQYLSYQDWTNCERSLRRALEAEDVLIMPFIEAVLLKLTELKNIGKIENVFRSAIDEVQGIALAKHVQEELQYCQSQQICNLSGCLAQALFGREISIGNTQVSIGVGPIEPENLCTITLTIRFDSTVTAATVSKVMELISIVANTWRGLANFGVEFRSERQRFWESPLREYIPISGETGDQREFHIPIPVFLHTGLNPVEISANFRKESGPSKKDIFAYTLYIDCPEHIPVDTDKVDDTLDAALEGTGYGK